jgi:predicted phage-related endonuclease
MNRFTIINCEQRTPEWYQARAGRATGSKADAIHARSRDRKEEGVTRRNYRVQLVAERLTGQPQENDYQSRAMANGVEKEPSAIAAYEAATGLLVRRTGFLAMSEYAAGCSLDGDVDDFRIILSVKCPEAPAHLKYLWERRIPPEYVKQATHELWVTGAKIYDFVSYNESFPEHLQLLIVRADRGEFDIAGHEMGTIQFLREVDDELRKLEKWTPPVLL